jgi:hypothetical protein
MAMHATLEHLGIDFDNNGINGICNGKLLFWFYNR